MSNPPQKKKEFASPWVELLSLDSKLTSSTEAQKELDEIRDQHEALYTKHEEVDKKIREKQLSLAQLEMELGILRATANKDKLNVEQTQEKLDIISLV